MKKVAVMLANGFEDIEALSVIDILRRADVEALGVGLEKRLVTGAHGVEVKADMVLDELKVVEFDMIVKKFDFIISSHYTACVQAYRNYVPVLLLGTAEKYKELAELLGQEKYNFDVLSEQCSNYAIVDAMDELVRDEDIAKTRLQTRMINIQTKSCFEVFDELKW